MDTKHTPGPWTARPQIGAGPMIVHEYETGKQMRPTGLRVIAHMLQRRDSLETDRANAALVVAAPELLAALKAAERDLTATYDALKLHGGPVVSIGQFRRLDSARAAIAKAEGR